MPNNLRHSRVQNLRCHVRKLCFSCPFLIIYQVLLPLFTRECASEKHYPMKWQERCPFWCALADSKAEGFLALEKGRKKNFPFGLALLHAIVVKMWLFSRYQEDFFCDWEAWPHDPLWAIKEKRLGAYITAYSVSFCLISSHIYSEMFSLHLMIATRF